jgi:hypothetical protein
VAKRRSLWAELQRERANRQRLEQQARVAELDSVLTTGLQQGPGVSFASLKHSVEMPPFDAGGLDDQFQGVAAEMRRGHPRSVCDD